MPSSLWTTNYTAFLLFNTLLPNSER
jgi:hypothetical protein